MVPESDPAGLSYKQRLVSQIDAKHKEQDICI